LGGVCLGLLLQAPFQGGALKLHLTQTWLHGMQKYRPNAPSYFNDTLLPHEGMSAWWLNRTLTNFSTINFPSVFWAGPPPFIARPVQRLCAS
jgi:hypothetical protein